jgi:hypothetical protein
MMILVKTITHVGLNVNQNSSHLFDQNRMNIVLNLTGFISL